MRLLVSVSSAAEASAALAGGADVIDAKNPIAGALGAVSLGVLRDIYEAVAGTRPVTAALGDATTDAALERDACAFAAAGARFVKVGFAGISSPARIAALTAAAVRGAAAGGDGGSSVVAVAYADADRVGSLHCEAFAGLAAQAGARGLLLDTADKLGPGLRGLLDAEALARWVDAAHAEGLFVTLAGKLAAADLVLVRRAGADIAGVRGAACEGGRTGRISTNKVALLSTLCHPAEAGQYATQPLFRT